MKAIISRIKCLWFVLTSRNVIVIHKIKEIQIDGQPGRRVAVRRRTDYNTESDYLTMKMAIYVAFSDVAKADGITFKD